MLIYNPDELDRLRWLLDEQDNPCAQNLVVAGLTDGMFERIIVMGLPLLFLCQPAGKIYIPRYNRNFDFCGPSVADLEIYVKQNPNYQQYRCIITFEDALKLVEDYDPALATLFLFHLDTFT